MTTRRVLILSTLGMLAAPGAALAQRGQARFVGGDDRPTLLPGRPPRVDCGHGLIIPLSGDTHGTLWEGDDRYVTFGRAVSLADAHARGHAEFTAAATMKLMLITLAFAPERLVRFAECGWKSRTGEPDDFVRGDVDLPGRPFSPLSEAFGGFFTPGPPGSTGADPLNPPYHHAACVYVVLKSEGGLDYVREHASLMCPHLVAEPPSAQRGEAAMAAGRQVCGA